jgi:hypothetical protein
VVSCKTALANPPRTPTVCEVDALPHRPWVVVKTTLADVGAETVIVRESPIFMGTAEGVRVTTGPVLFDVWAIPKVPAGAVTLIVADVVAPAADAVIVAVPVAVPVPATVSENLPNASVEPVVGISVSWPPVVVIQEAVNGVLASPVPCAFLAIKVTVTDAAPLLGTLEPVLLNTESVEPDICIWICAVAPALAVIVAVRLAKLLVPDLKVKVAVPSTPVVTVDELTMPVSAPKDTAIPGTAAFEELSAVTVKVVEPVLSDGTVKAEAEIERLATLVVVKVEVVPVVVLGPVPQLTNRAVIAANIKAVKGLA